MRTAILLATLALVACNCQPTPTPAPVPTPAPPAPVLDAEPRPAPDSYDDACAVLARLGCPEGKAPNCAATMRHADEGALTVVPLACITSATTVPAVRACGFVRCIPVIFPRRAVGFLHRSTAERNAAWSALHRRAP